MTINTDHLHESLVNIIHQPKEERIQFMANDFWINHHVSNEILQLLTKLLHQPKKQRMQSLLIIAEPNMGKSSLIAQFSRLHPNITVEDDEGMSSAHCPVLLIDAPSTADEKGLFIAILEQMWAPFRPNDTPAKLKHQAKHILRECNVRMVIIDEIHNLLSTTPVKQRQIMNTIKTTLSNELKIPIVGVGTSDAAIILTNDPQHASRFDTVVIPKWEMDKNFRGLLAAFEKRFPLKKPSNLASKDKAPLLLAFSGGNIGDLHRLLKECSTYAIEHDIEEITVDIIQKFKWVKPTNTRRSRQIVFNNV